MRFSYATFGEFFNRYYNVERPNRTIITIPLRDINDPVTWHYTGTVPQYDYDVYSIYFWTNVYYRVAELKHEGYFELLERMIKGAHSYQ